MKERVLPEDAFLHGKEIGEHHETDWGDISLVRAMLSLLKQALKSTSLTHFAFVSESCVPVKPWREMRRRLRLDPRSMIAAEDVMTMKEKHRDRISKVRDLPGRAMRLHSQWSLLDREAAECLTEHDFTDRFSGIFAADEHYIGTVLMLRGYPEEKISPLDATWARWSNRQAAPKASKMQVRSSPGSWLLFPDSSLGNSHMRR